MCDRIGSLTSKAADILQLQFAEASLDRLLVGLAIAPLAADKQKAPARISPMQGRSSIECQQLILARCDGPHEAGDEKFLPGPQSSAQRGCGCSFQASRGKVDTVPHYVCAISG